MSFLISYPLVSQPIFSLAQKEAAFSDEEMYRMFNMGKVFFVICSAKDAKDVMDVCEECGQEAAIAGKGESSKKTKVEVVLDGKKLSVQDISLLPFLLDEP